MSRWVLERSRWLSSRDSVVANPLRVAALFLLLGFALVSGAIANVSGPDPSVNTNCGVSGVDAGGNCLNDVGSGGVSTGPFGPPPTACTAGAFDLSLSTGCNLPFYVSGIFP